MIQEQTTIFFELEPNMIICNKAVVNISQNLNLTQPIIVVLQNNAMRYWRENLDAEAIYLYLLRCDQDEIDRHITLKLIEAISEYMERIPMINIPNQVYDKCVRIISLLCTRSNEAKEILNTTTFMDDMGVVLEEQENNILYHRTLEEYIKLKIILET
eukprot:TRINITY_DN6931_c0_g4_i1.p1 TRINITY_DN6931_c0_g4~~TRINITY_DN6931_c0_g4_i1.p1  ORF type:complete len:158 (+),score=29.02 TRINITY_DN6931_c0_g4_i1:230-703(+)